MNSVAVYCSQTGSAKTYAEWLSEDLQCPVVPLDRIEQAAESRDLVVFCSWFHAASIKGSKKFKAYMAAHPDKRYAVVGVGATPMPCEMWPFSEVEEAFYRSFPKEEYPNLPWCYCQGNFHFDRLGALDKIAMRMYFSMLEKSAKDGSGRDAEALARMKEGYDGCNRAYLAPILEAIANLE